MTISTFGKSIDFLQNWPAFKARESKKEFSREIVVMAFCCDQSKLLNHDRHQNVIGVIFYQLYGVGFFGLNVHWIHPLGLVSYTAQQKC